VYEGKEATAWAWQRFEQRIVYRVVEHGEVWPFLVAFAFVGVRLRRIELSAVIAPGRPVAF
jgi:hypothetical protein